MSTSSPFPPALANAPGGQTILALGAELFGVVIDADSPEPLKEWATASLLRLHCPDHFDLAGKLDAHIATAAAQFQAMGSTKQ